MCVYVCFFHCYSSDDGPALLSDTVQSMATATVEDEAQPWGQSLEEEEGKPRESLRAKLSNKILGRARCNTGAESYVDEPLEFMDPELLE